MHYDSQCLHQHEEMLQQIAVLDIGLLSYHCISAIYRLRRRKRVAYSSACVEKDRELAYKAF
jgi:cbb3-type cytochrome oxidase subunit 3